MSRPLWVTRSWTMLKLLRKLKERKKKKKKIIFANSKMQAKEITRSHNIRLSIHFNGRCPRAFQLLKPIFSNLSGRF
jgi:superfamily II DNA/RNA helicase